jgi:hypothetical protein
VDDMAIVQTDGSALFNQARRNPAGSAVTGPTDQHRPTTVHQVYVKRPFKCCRFYLEHRLALRLGVIAQNTCFLEWD